MNLKIIGLKSALNFLNRIFIENRIEPYAKAFSWDKWFSALEYKTSICRGATENKYHNIQDNDSSVRNTESGNKCPLLVLPYQGVQVSSLAESWK